MYIPQYSFRLQYKNTKHIKKKYLNHLFCMSFSIVKRFMLGHTYFFITLIMNFTSCFMALRQTNMEVFLFTHSKMRERQFLSFPWELFPSTNIIWIKFGRNFCWGNLCWRNIKGSLQRDITNQWLVSGDCLQWRPEIISMCNYGWSLWQKFVPLRRMTQMSDWKYYTRLAENLRCGGH